EEAAIGYQIRCHDCKEEETKGKSFMYYFALTNSEYWEELKQDYRTLPCEIPHLGHWCALTWDLFNMIVELRVPLTAMGMVTHIERESRASYLSLNTKTNQCHAPAASLSFDHTFCVARKATIVAKDGKRERVWKGGMFSAVNKKNEIVLYIRTHRYLSCFTTDNKFLQHFCQSGANNEFGESLAGMRRRLEVLGVLGDLIVVADNCCTVAAAVEKNLPGSFLGLDLKHFKRRYEAVIVGGVHDPHRAAVLRDIVDAILESPA
ncbi:hypothetical protein BC835DRAFT_1234568, partial [Cytidiella melzeri]